MDDDDFLAAVEADNANVRVEEPKEEPAPLELTEEAPEEPVQAETPVEPAPEPDAKPEPQSVPITAMLDERDKRKALEQELAQLRASQQQQQPQAVPDVFEDPDGFAAYQDQKVQQALYQQNLRWSERTATIEHGAETVNQAKEWAVARCDADPYFNAKVAASPDPIGFAVSEWKREQIASQVTPEDLTQFQAWKAAQAQLQASAAPQGAAEPITPRTPPPRSLASAPSAGNVLTEVEPTEEDIFAGAIPKR